MFVYQVVSLGNFVVRNDDDRLGHLCQFDVTIHLEEILGIGHIEQILKIASCPIHVGCDPLVDGCHVCKGSYSLFRKWEVHAFLSKSAQVEQLLQYFCDSDKILCGVHVQIPYVYNLELHGCDDHQVNETIVHQVTSYAKNILTIKVIDCRTNKQQDTRLCRLREVLSCNLLDLFANPPQTIGETGQTVD
jgi:hypothetical protein